MAAADSGEFAIKVWGLISDFDRAVTDTHCDDAVHEQDQRHQCILRDNLDRFRLWAGSLGAFHQSSDSRSLDHRVRKAPQVKTRLGELLVALSENVQEVHRDSSENTSRKIAEQPTGTSTQDELDLLDMLGLTEDISMKSCSKVSHACQNIAEDISHLFKLTALISKSIARDRYARAEAESKEKFDDQYDIAHVKAKFKEGKLKETTPEWLLLRLGQAITKRRQYIKYVREHRSRIENGFRQPRDPDLPSFLSLKGPLQVTSPSTTVPLASRPSQMSTTATTVMSKAPLGVEQAFEDDRSVTIVDTTPFDWDPDLKLSVPPLIDYSLLGQEFPCPFCPTNIKFNSQGSWTRHVYADLRAYLCTHKECGMTMFEHKRSWIDHEMEEHWRRWFCHLCEFDSHRESDVVLHLERLHNKVLIEGAEDYMVYMTSHPLDYISASKCTLCDWGNKMVSRISFMDHLAHHLEQLALFAVPRINSGKNSGNLPSNQAAKQDSRDHSRDFSGFAREEFSIESATKAGGRNAVDSSMRRSLGGQAASLITLRRMFPSEIWGDGGASAWRTHVDSRNTELVELFDILTNARVLCGTLARNPSSELEEDLEGVVARWTESVRGLRAATSEDARTALMLDDCDAALQDFRAYAPTYAPTEFKVHHLDPPQLATLSLQFRALKRKISHIQIFLADMLKIVMKHPSPPNRALSPYDSDPDSYDSDSRNTDSYETPMEDEPFAPTTDMNFNAPIVDVTSHAAPNDTQTRRQEIHSVAGMTQQGPVDNLPSIGQQMNESGGTTVLDKTTTEREISMSRLWYSGMFDRQQSIQAPCANTFGWIFDESGVAWKYTPNASNPFFRFLEGDESLFWLSGKRGSGKSTMMRMIEYDRRTRERLSCWTDGRVLLIMSVYLDRTGSPLQKNIEGLLRSLLYQLFRAEPIGSRSPVAAMLGRYDGWTTKKLSSALETAFRGLSQRCVFLILDGLEECEGDHSELLDFIIGLQTCSGVKICVASGPWDMFQRKLRRWPDMDFSNMHAMIARDISIFFKSRWATEIPTGLAGTLIDRSAGSFIEATFLADTVETEILTGAGEGTLKDIIDKIPPGARLKRKFDREQEELHERDERHKQEEIHQWEKHHERSGGKKA